MTVKWKQEMKKLRGLNGSAIYRLLIELTPAPGNRYSHTRTHAHTHTYTWPYVHCILMWAIGPTYAHMFFPLPLPLLTHYILAHSLALAVAKIGWWE